MLSTLFMCVFTVLAPTHSDPAISALDRPRAASVSTSVSRGVSSPTSARALSGRGVERTNSSIRRRVTVRGLGPQVLGDEVIVLRSGQAGALPDAPAR